MGSVEREVCSKMRRNVEEGVISFAWCWGGGVISVQSEISSRSLKWTGRKDILDKGNSMNKVEEAPKTVVHP